MRVISSREEFQWLLLVVMGYLLSLLPESFLWIGCLSCILVLGVPHGALDIYLIWSESKRNLSKSLAALGRYIALVVVALLIWRGSSEVFWFLFFLSAIYHFGSSDEHPEVVATVISNSFNRFLWHFSRGLVLVFAPAAFHPEKIINYLRQATSNEFAHAFGAVAPFLFGYGLLFYLAGSALCFRRVKGRAYRMLLTKHLISLLLLVILFWVSDPLVGFCLYFCCHHSLTHCFRVVSLSKIKKSSLALLGALFTVPVIPVWGGLSTRMAGGLVPEGVVSACFVVIAALTFPHLLVVQKWHLKLRRPIPKLSEHTKQEHTLPGLTF